MLSYCPIKMRAAFLLTPSFLHNSREDRGKKGNSHFGETLSLCYDTTVVVDRKQKKHPEKLRGILHFFRIFCLSSMTGFAVTSS